jgi:hypothetical protein
VAVSSDRLCKRQIATAVEKKDRAITMANASRNWLRTLELAIVVTLAPDFREENCY